VVFSRGRLPNNLTFTFNEMEIGIVSEFNYLGVLLSKSGNFSMARKAQVEKATKAMLILNHLEKLKTKTGISSHSV
jgi:hypothetical protein